MADGGKLDSWGDFGDMEDNREAVRIIIGKEKTGGEDPRNHKIDKLKFWMTSEHGVCEKFNHTIYVSSVCYFFNIRGVV